MFTCQGSHRPGAGLAGLRGGLGAVGEADESGAEAGETWPEAPLEADSKCDYWAKAEMRMVTPELPILARRTETPAYV